ncbi:MAG: hypothetical protein VXV96_17605 [Bdellovibrionota bacterium]|nr:hypothetical protein [Bdellovibrionota bacterium]
MSKKKKSLFLLNRSLHRDIGYLSIGFTIIFALSGLALNHRDDWNPNYSMQREVIKLSPKERSSEEVLLEAKNHFSLPEKMKGKFWVDPNQLKVFYPHDTTLIYLKDKNELHFEKITPRFLLRRFNGLHVNELKSYWIAASDLYSLCLLYLALSALFMVKGKYGIKGRGGILTLIGLIIPAFFFFQII